MVLYVSMSTMHVTQVFLSYNVEISTFKRPYLTLVQTPPEQQFHLPRDNTFLKHRSHGIVNQTNNSQIRQNMCVVLLVLLDVASFEYEIYTIPSSVCE